MEKPGDRSVSVTADESGVTEMWPTRSANVDARRAIGFWAGLVRLAEPVQPVHCPVHPGRLGGPWVVPPPGPGERNHDPAPLAPRRVPANLAVLTLGTTGSAAIFINNRMG